MTRPTGEPTSRGYHHGDLRRALLDAAEALMAEGDDDPSLRAVARRAGVSHAAPYKHFADRHALRAGVAERGFEALRGEMERAVANAGEAPLRAIGRAYLGFALANPARYRLMFGPEFAGGHGTPELDRTAQAAFDALMARQPYSDTQTGGDTQTGDRATAVASWSLVHGLATLLIDGRVAVPDGRDRLDFAVDAMGRLRPATG
jgi:AcrR family transcriptional regulator